MGVFEEHVPSLVDIYVSNDIVLIDLISTTVEKIWKFCGEGELKRGKYMKCIVISQSQ